MRIRTHLPFIGLIVLAGTVSVYAGVGKVDKRDRGNGKPRPVLEPSFNFAGPTSQVVTSVAVATTDATIVAAPAAATTTAPTTTTVAPTTTTAAPTTSTVVAPSAPRLGPAEPQVEAVGDDGVVDRSGTTTTLDSAWRPATKIKTAAGAVTKCGSTFSGGSDAAGLIYHACGSAIHVRTPKGVFRKAMKPGESAPIGRRDVAANPAGTLVYYTVGEREDTDLTATQLAAGWGSVHRMKLTSSGAWKRDTTWSAGPFKLYGGAPWSARYLTVGTDGILYTSVNAFIFAIDQQGRLRADENVQYDTVGTRIGGPIAGYDAAGSAPGFNVVEGLAMSPDGRYLYAVEEDYDYLARFVRDANGAWTPDRIAATPNSAGCTTTTLAAPYDVATSRTGDVYVANTTCGEIRRYDAALTYQGSVLKIAGMLPHGLAMAGNGAFILPWRNEIYARR